MSDAMFRKRLRGVILKLVRDQHARQKHRYDDYDVLKRLDVLGFDVYLDLVREQIQDLIERQCLAALVQKDEKTGEVSYDKIEIRPRGRDVLEGTEPDAGILIERVD